MSQPPPTSSHPPVPEQQKHRPRARWFVVGGLLLVLAPVVFVGALFTVLGPLFREDAVFAADGQPHAVSVAAGQQRALFTSTGTDAVCRATDGTGAEVAFTGVGGSFTVNEWQAVARFETGDGDLTFTCRGAGTSGDVRVGQLPSGSAVVGGLAVGILLPLALGGAGLVVLLVTGVLWATRPARPTP